MSVALSPTTAKADSNRISPPVGGILARRGWFVNEFGADMELDLGTYDFSGPKKSKFRQAAQKIQREGCTIEEWKIPPFTRIGC
jgi:lysylphosphatidylglycerol synthetase-like protein (DUF2156 family)